jgi:hypothetical protein
MRLLGATAVAFMLAPAVAQQGFGALATLVAERCADCHDEASSKGGLDFAARERADATTWLTTLSRVRDRVASGEMPPPGEEALAAKDREALAAFASAELAREVPKLPRSPGSVTVRRLSRTQWENTVRDLFGVAVASTAAFPADDLGYGFDSIGDALTLSTLHLEKYLAAAGDVAAAVFHGEDANAPAVRRAEGERMRLLDGPGVSQDGEFANLYTNATIAADVPLPRDGVYRLRVRVAATQAGDEPAKMAVRLDGRELCVIDVEGAGMRVEDITLPTVGGMHRWDLAFVNDHYEPQHPDPQRRDRNLRIDWLEIEGPIDPRPVRGEQQWLRGVDDAGQPDGRRLRALAGALLPRAWRRPVTAEETTRLAAVGEQALARGEPLLLAQRRVVQAALVSPNFLFRVESGDGPLQGSALAVRLSYLLWSSMPDDELRAAAARGELGTVAGRRAQLRRMLADPRAEALATDFAAQWLELRALVDRMPDPERFACDAALKASMRRETELLFAAVLREDLDVRTLVDADFTHVDARLAAFYGISGAFDESFTRVALPPELRTRGGVLGHASVLLVTSNPTRTSPVKRGKWVLENLLGQAPPPPPPGNDSFTDEAAAATPRGLREQLALHRQRAACAGCHVRMDALGFALERFDAIGRRRDGVEHGAIDDHGELPGGAVLDGLPGLKRALLADPALPRTIARKLFVHAVGRDLGPVERLRLDLAVDQLAATGKVTLAALLDLVVEGDAFLARG